MDKRDERNLSFPHAPVSLSPRPRTLAQAVEAYSERLVRLGAEIVAIGPGVSADLRSAVS